MFKNTTINNNSNGNSGKDSIKRLIFNKSPKRYNLATSLLTAGLLSALVACGGSSGGSNDSNGGSNDSNGGSNDSNGGSNANSITSIDFNSFTLANDKIVKTTRYVGDKDTTTLYIIEGNIITEDQNDALGQMSVEIEGEGTITYKITSTNTFEYGIDNGDKTVGSNKVADYFTIDNMGNLKLAVDTEFDFGMTTLEEQDDRYFTFEVKASAGNVSDTHTVTVQLGDNHTVSSGNTPDNVTYILSAGDDLFEGGSGHDAFSGGDGNDSLKGGSGNDSLYGGAGDDILRGDDDGVHHDLLYGGAGNDIIHAGHNDYVYAGEGNDVIYGGRTAGFIYGDGLDGINTETRLFDVDGGEAGADKFVFDYNTGDSSPKDLIVDFNRRGRGHMDKIVFENANGYSFDSLKIAYKELQRSVLTNEKIMAAVITYGTTGTLTVEGWDGSNGRMLEAKDFMFVNTLNP